MPIALPNRVVPTTFRRSVFEIVVDHSYTKPGYTIPATADSPEVVVPPEVVPTEWKTTVKHQTKDAQGNAGEWTLPVDSSDLQADERTDLRSGCRKVFRRHATELAFAQNQ